LNANTAKALAVSVIVAVSLHQILKLLSGTTAEIVMGTRFIGIDPGMGGGIALIDGDTIDAIKMPPESDIAGMLKALCIEDNKPVGIAYIEDIPKGFAGMVNQSAMAKLHRNYGFCLGVLAALRIEHHLVRPQLWQKGIPGVQGKKGVERKRALKDHACRIFPNVKVTLKNCDALLIANWGRKDHHGNNQSG
jgi:hypothetical protein